MVSPPDALIGQEHQATGSVAWNIGNIFRGPEV